MKLRCEILPIIKPWLTSYLSCLVQTGKIQESVGALSFFPAFFERFNWIEQCCLYTPELSLAFMSSTIFYQIILHRSIFRGNYKEVHVSKGVI